MRIALVSRCKDCGMEKTNSKIDDGQIRRRGDVSNSGFGVLIAPACRQAGNEKN